MDPSSLRALIDRVASGDCTPDDAVRQLRRLPYADLGFARIDHHRDLRQGMPEAVYGPGKTPEHCAAIVGELLAASTAPVLLTRATDDQVKAVSAHTEALGYGQRATSPRPGSSRTMIFRPATAATPGDMVVDHGRHGGPARGRTNARPCSALSGSRPTSWSTAAWPASTGCWPRSTSWPWPTWWW